jgi:phage terminase large subunit-like protein
MFNPHEVVGNSAANTNDAALAAGRILRLLDRAESPIQEAAALLGSRALHDALTPEERLAVRYIWPLWARRLRRVQKPQWLKREPGFGVWRGQLRPPGPWSVLLYMAGRGSGKTRFGGETVRAWAHEHPGCRIAMVGATAADVWGTMLEGESGLLACCPPWDKPAVHTTKRRVVWANGSMAILYSADKPARLRGPQHHFAWADETCAWRYLDAWDQLMFGLRLGPVPQVAMTTTPRPLDLIRELAQDESTALLIGSSRDNAANINLKHFGKYDGTALGRQETDGELLDEMPGALWKREWFAHVSAAPKLNRIVIGFDPAETSGKDADDSGIVAAGLGEDGLGYILDDRTVHATPDAAARAVVKAYFDFGAGAVIVDATRNGELAKSLIAVVDPRVRVLIKGGNRGKRAWAEPISALYEQGRVRHVALRDPKTGRVRVSALEDQMCNWSDDVRDWSPDRLDASVYALTELMLREAPSIKGLNDTRTAARRM